jgi:hypothetical protein
VHLLRERGMSSGFSKGSAAPQRARIGAVIFLPSLTGRASRPPWKETTPRSGSPSRTISITPVPPKQ